MPISDSFCECRTEIEIDIGVTPYLSYTTYNTQLDFQFEPGVANGILENEAKSFLAVA